MDYQRVPHLQKFPNWKSKVPAVTFEVEIEGNLSSMSSEDKQEVHIDLYLVVFDQADDDRTNDNSGNTRGVTELAEPISNSWKATSRASAHPQRTLFHEMVTLLRCRKTQFIWGWLVNNLSDELSIIPRQELPQPYIQGSRNDQYYFNNLSSMKTPISSCAPMLQFLLRIFVQIIEIL